MTDTTKRRLLKAGSLAPQDGFWWNPAESGRGYAIEVQGSQVILGAYMYEASGAATWTLATLRLQVAGVDELAAALDARFADSPGLFDGEGLAIDLAALRTSDAVVDFAALLPHLRKGEAPSMQHYIAER